MKNVLRIAVTVACLAALKPLAAAPTSMPTTEPTWVTDANGRLILRAFDGAPFPHASRANGYTSKSAGTLPTTGHYDDPTVGIFVPSGYVPGDAVDYVVHFHGWHNHVSKVIPEYDLEAQMLKSRVNAILLVPQGPKDAADSGGGKLEHDDGAFARLIAEVTTYLHAQGVIHTDTVRHIVLSTHSGGYAVTASILHLGGLTDHITDVALLDSSYGGLPWFVDFVKADPSRRIVSFHTQHLDDENAQLATLLQQAGVAHRELPESSVTTSAADFAQRGVTIIATTLPHDGVPAQHDFLATVLATSKLEKRRSK